MCELFFQCDKGAAGDIIGAALMELVPDKESMLDKLNHMAIPGVEYILEKKEKYGIQGNSMTVRIHGKIEEDVIENHGKSEKMCQEEHHHDEAHAHHGEHHHDGDHAHHGEHPHHSHGHHHMTMQDIDQIVTEMHASDRVKKNIRDIYDIIAEAESEAHSCPVSEVHFHEVGAIDAIADIAAVCSILEELKPSEILASEIHVGNGTIECAHGILPVPAPATANILRELPYDSGDIDGEICTPTGAALIRYFADRYVEEKPVQEKKTGIGFGKRTFSTPSYFKACLM